MKRLLTLLVAGTLLAGCSTNGLAQLPAVNSVNVASIGKLEFAVGTANIGPDGVVALNTVASLRQANGDAAVLLNTPQIVGPAGFAVPSTAAVADPYHAGNMTGNGDGGSGGDAGTTTINATAQNLNPAIANAVTTFGQTGGLFEYGFGPFNSNELSSPFYPGRSAKGATEPFYFEPLYSPDPQRILGGPPAYGFFTDGTQSPNFVGYAQGWTAFETGALVTGTYTLNVNVPSVNVAATTFSATAALANTTPLPLATNLVFTPDANLDGGATGSVNIPADARFVEAMVYIRNITKGTFFSVGPIKSTGTQAFTLPANLGSCNAAPGCENTANASPTFTAPAGSTAGDSFRMTVVVYDYPAFEASPSISTSQTPTITGPGSNGQADLSISTSITGAY